MFLTDITLGQAGLYALLGYAVVFFGLILLMLVVITIGKFFTAKTKQTQPVQDAPAAAPAPEAPTAPGTAGQLKLYNVDPKTAAMLMAIVADKMGKPINELRFLSIKEVTE
jgi:Na+-transporting methylmalonyl-CoA/oxaloacetate decarboxylase gamma subunit